MVGDSELYAIYIKLSSRDICSFIRLIWNLTAFAKVILGVSINAPPFIITVAASGTYKTLNPICCKTTESVAKAVVFPAHGPPVKHILVIGCLLCFKALGCPMRSSRQLFDGLLNGSSC